MKIVAGESDKNVISFLDLDYFLSKNVAKYHVNKTKKQESGEVFKPALAPCQFSTTYLNVFSCMNTEVNTLHESLFLKVAPRYLTLNNAVRLCLHMLRIL
jgi:hypothetical protein